MTDQNGHSERPGRETSLRNGHAASGSLVAVEPSARRMPAARSSAALASSAGPEPRAVLASLRRRWLVALLLGLLLGGGAAAAVWFGMPTTYYVYAELRVREKPDAILYDAHDSAAFKTYKETWIYRARHPDVLIAALRTLAGDKRPRMIPEDVDDIEWLQENLDITSPGVEFIRIGMRGDDPKEQKQLVDAVANALVADYQTVEDSTFTKRERNLRDLQLKLQGELETEQSHIKQLAELLHTSDTEVLSEQQRAAVEFLSKLRQAHAQVRFEIMQAKARLAALEQPATTEAAETPVDTAIEPAPGTGADAGADGEPVKLAGAVAEGAAEQARQATPDAEPNPSEGESAVNSQLVLAEVNESEEVRMLHSRRLRLQEMLRVARERVSSEDHEAVRRLEEAIAAAELQLQETRDRLKPLAAERIRQRIAADNESTVAQLKRQIEVLKQQESALGEELANLDTDHKAVGKKSFELENHKDAVASLEKTISRVADELRRLDIEYNAEPRIDFYQEARIPSGPEIARKAKFSGVAGFGVLALLIGGIVLTDLHARRISSLDEVVDGLSLRVLGSLPIMPRSVVNGKRAVRGGRPAALRGLWKESIDSTRTMLLRESHGDGLKTIMVVSATGGEGKTTLACHLATSLAQAGRRTLLIDADLRRPSVHRVYGLSLAPGLSELIRDDCTLEEAVRASHLPELAVMSAGVVDQLALRLLAKEATRPIFDHLRSQFDFIVVDSAPVLPVSDASIIGQHVDAALFSIRRDVSRFGKVASACQRLSMLGIPLLGAVVIGLDESIYGKRYDTRTRTDSSFTRVA